MEKFTILPLTKRECTSIHYRMADMPKKPEDIAREAIDRMLEQSGWAVQDLKAANICATRGAAIRTSPMPRIAITVDIIATGTKRCLIGQSPNLKSRRFFEQMKGRGVRVINDDDLKAITPFARTKDYFIIVDAVGVCEQDKTDSRPMEKKPSVSFEKLLQPWRFCYGT